LEAGRKAAGDMKPAAAATQSARQRRNIGLKRKRKLTLGKRVLTHLERVAGNGLAAVRSISRTGRELRAVENVNEEYQECDHHEVRDGCEKPEDGKLDDALRVELVFVAEMTHALVEIVPQWFGRAKCAARREQLHGCAVRHTEPRTVQGTSPWRCASKGRGFAQWVASCSVSVSVTEHRAVPKESDEDEVEHERHKGESEHDEVSNDGVLVFLKIVREYIFLNVLHSLHRVHGVCEECRGHA